MAFHTYIQAIGVGFPTVQCHAFGDGSVYSDLVWDAGDPIPSQATLDTWISANPITEHPKITVLAFRNRFTQAEKIAMEMASIDNPNATMQQRALAASLRVAQADLNVATFVDTTRPDTVAGIQSLETYGIIGAGRADEILNAPVQSIEIAIGY